MWNYLREPDEVSDIFTDMDDVHVLTKDNIKSIETQEEFSI